MIATLIEAKEQLRSKFSGRRGVSVGGDENLLEVWLYGTRIVQIKGGVIKLYAKGWKTRTTKKVMNEVSVELGLGYVVRQKDGVWFIEYMGTRTEWDGEKIGLV